MSQNKLRDGTLTLLESCDNIQMLVAMDRAHRLAHIRDGIRSMASIYSLSAGDVDAEYVDMLMDVKRIIADEYGLSLEARLENFDGSSWPKILNV